MVVDVVKAGAALAGEALVIAAAALLFLGLVRPCRRLLLGVKVIVKVVVRIEVSAARRLIGGVLIDIGAETQHCEQILVVIPV